MRRVMVLLAAIAMAACGGDDGDEHPTAEQAARRFLESYCARLQSCLGAVFSAAYSSVQACVDQGLQAIPADKRNQTDACTNSEIDTCVQDIDTMACPTSAASSLPASCQKC